jgi:hypothetical protein
VLRLLPRSRGRRRGVEAAVEVLRLLPRSRGRRRGVEAAVEVFKAAVEVLMLLSRC